MIKKLYLKFGGDCYTARVSNEGVKTFDYKILLCKFEFYYDADHPNFTMFYNSLLVVGHCKSSVIQYKCYMKKFIVIHFKKKISVFHVASDFQP